MRTEGVYIGTTGTSGKVHHREEITDEELAALTTAIKTKFGLDFTNYEKKSLKRGFARLISRNNLGSLLGLWQKVMNDRDYLLGCIDDLTVNLTELFRNPEIWIKMRDHVLEDYKTRSSMNIWHAGCSTGEEVYTMRMILDQKGLGFRTKSLGTDLSNRALAKAKEGAYSQMLIKRYARAFSEVFTNKTISDHFKLDGETARIENKYTRNVEFRQHNLVHDPSPGTFDIVLCRNVMIYFDDVLKKEVLELLHNSLTDDGFLVIGYYDALPDFAKEMFEAYDSRTRIYKKRN